MAKKQRTTNVSIEFGSNLFKIVLPLLGVNFIVLKILHYIDWPWVWVLAPLWIPFVIGVVIMLIIIVAVFGLSAIKKLIR